MAIGLSELVEQKILPALKECVDSDDFCKLLERYYEDFEAMSDLLDNITGKDFVAEQLYNTEKELHDLERKCYP